MKDGKLYGLAGVGSKYALERAAELNKRDAAMGIKYKVHELFVGKELFTPTPIDHTKASA
jgi:hypothetical protein